MAMMHVEKITTANLHDFPISLAKDAIGLLQYYEQKGFEIVLSETAPKYQAAYFIAQKGNSQTIIASIQGLLYTKLNSRISYFFTARKSKTYNYLKQANVLVPDYCFDSENYKSLLTKTPLVVKPVNGTKGEGVSMNINEEAALQEAVQEAKKYSDRVLIQQQVAGQDHRLLFIGGKFFAAIQRDPPQVKGDGQQTLENLIKQCNEQKAAVYPDYAKTLGQIDVNHLDKSLDLQAIPMQGETVVITSVANISLGAKATDVSNQVNKLLISQLESILSMWGLMICGVDVMSTDISSNPDEQKSYVIEINSSPGLVPHMYPDSGEPKDAFERVFSQLETG